MRGAACPRAAGIDGNRCTQAGSFYHSGGFHRGALAMACDAWASRTKPVNQSQEAMPEPQALLMPVTEAAISLVVTVDAGAEEDVRDLFADVAGLRRSVGFRFPDGELSCVVGIGSALWDRLFGGARPAKLHVLQEIVGSKH